MDIKVNDIVRFKRGLYADEEKTTYRVIEMNGDRCFIEYISNLFINPQSVARVEELELINE